MAAVRAAPETTAFAAVGGEDGGTVDGAEVGEDGAEVGEVESSWIAPFRSAVKI